MQDAVYAAAPGRAVLWITGADRVSFLQGLVSNDVARVAPDRAVWAALLSPQGRYLHDFFIAEEGEALLLETEAERVPDLLRKLKLYRLRAQVALEEAPELATFLVWGAGADSLGLTERGAARSEEDEIKIFRDPRLAELGLRVIGPEEAVLAFFEREGIAPGDFADWDRLRLELGVPDGSRDLFTDRALLLENGFDELDGVSWNKGCYVGQELTARTKYRGLVKKRLIPVLLEGTPPPPGTILTASGQEVGEMRSALGQHGLALLRLEALDGAMLVTDAGNLTPVRPGWWRQE